MNFSYVDIFREKAKRNNRFDEKELRKSILKPVPNKNLMNDLIMDFFVSEGYLIV